MLPFDKYEDFYTLEETLTSLQLWEGMYQGRDEEIEELYHKLTWQPIWKAPFDHLVSVLLRVPSPENSAPPHKKPLKEVHDALQYDKKRTLIMEFRSDLYPVFGYKSPRGLDDKRIPVPAYVWLEGVEVDWERSGVKNGTLAFEGVRVVDKYDPDMKMLWKVAEGASYEMALLGEPDVPLKAIAAQGVPLNIPDNLPDELSYKAASIILPVIDQLIVAKKLDGEMQRKDQHRIVRNELIKQNQAGQTERVYSKEPIRAALAIRFPKKK